MPATALRNINNMNKKQLRLRISRVISTFKTCRPRGSAASGPPVLHVDFPTPPPPPPPRPSPTRRMAAAVAAAGCRSFSQAPLPPVGPGIWVAAEDDMSRARETPAYLWRKEEKWHVVNVTKEEFGTIERRKKIDCDADEDEDDDDLFPASVRQMAASRRRKREIQIRRRRHSQKSVPHRNSTSSVASGSWFSSDDDQENDERSEEFNFDNEDDEGDDTDTLLSSRSFSTDSSIVANRPRTSGAAAMLSRLMPCGADNNRAKVVKESFAVVKRSEDPKGDFRRSMAEMVIEKGIYDAVGLEQLLNCFLSLNSQQHHRAIMSAFADIWDAVFPAEN